uniref:Glycolipid sulfotransferase n=1 Tax=Gracilariopsis lemaneiformis TaxID=2782 RepID=A0A291B0A4_GRALE|nr:glycolipid sulfotransferase [Gracilariopsis lemaneiformis]
MDSNSNQAVPAGLQRPSFSDLRAEARRILNLYWGKQVRTFPKPTGFSVYHPRSTDIIVVTNPKAGTTLLQNMTYQIAVATGGAPHFDPDGTNFDDINYMAPWVDYGPEFGRLECDSDPRIFKTHGRLKNFDLQKAKYIYCMRDPMRFSGSQMDFLFDIMSEVKVTDPKLREELLQEHVRQRLLGNYDEKIRVLYGKEKGEPGDWFLNVKEWTERPHKNVLILFYENVVRDLRGTALCIANFMGRKLTKEGLERVVSRCERKAMVGNPKFDCGVEAVVFKVEGAQKAKAEGRDGFAKIPIREELVKEIGKMLKATTGFEKYEDLREHLMARQERLFPDTSHRCDSENHTKDDP